MSKKLIKSFAFLLIFTASSLMFSQDWYICLGSFKNEDRAQTRAELLQSNRLDVFITEVPSGKSTLYRILLNESFKNLKQAHVRKNQITKLSVINKLGIDDVWCCQSDGRKAELKPKSLPKQESKPEPKAEPELQQTTAPIIEEPEVSDIVSEANQELDPLPELAQEAEAQIEESQEEETLPPVEEPEVKEPELAPIPEAASEAEAQVKEDEPAIIEATIKTETEPEVLPEEDNVKEEPEIEEIPEPQIEEVQDLSQEATEEAEPQAEETTEPEIQHEVEPQIEEETDPEIQPETEPKTEEETEPEIQAEAEPQVETEAEAEPETQKSRTVIITDSDTSIPVEGAVIEIDSNWQLTTDAEGSVTLPEDVADGKYSIKISKEKYVTVNASFTVDDGEITSANQFSIPKEVDYERIKIVLNWGKTPKDLDAHLYNGVFKHVSFKNKKSGNMRLDIDNTTGFGPETITVEKVDKKATYKYYVSNYTVGTTLNALAKSEAQVSVFINNDYYATYKIPEDAEGLSWHVFDIVNGEIVVRNQMEKSAR